MFQPYVRKLKVTDEQILAALRKGRSISAAAEALGVSVLTVDRRCRRGKLAIAHQKCADRGRRRGGARAIKLARSALLAAIASAPSVRVAARQLGIARASLRTRCAGDDALRAAFETLRERGELRANRSAA